MTMTVLQEPDKRWLALRRKLEAFSQSEAIV